MFEPIAVAFITFAVLCACLLFGVLVFLGYRSWKDETPHGFIIKPYIQLGLNPQKGERRSLEILWHDVGAADEWFVHIHKPASGRSHILHPTVRVIDIPDANPPIHPHHQFRVEVTDLAPGEEFEYRIHRQGAIVFTGTARAPKGRGSNIRFAVLGDIAKWGKDERRIASRIYGDKPDFVAVVGDAVYLNGRLNEYLSLFFPVYNAEVHGPASGAPLMRSTLMVFAPGNHCLGRPEPRIEPNFDEFADLFGYFMLWSQPLNGPTAEAAWRSYTALKGANSRIKAMRVAAGSRFPRMLSFSFDYGDSHWVIVDSNLYMDWNDKELRDWLEKDLAAAKEATWKFVMFHHSAFHSNRHHQDGVRMRLVADIFERHGVDVVFAGHVHAYERTRPLKFKVKPYSRGRLMNAFGHVQGEFTLDMEFDGVTKTTPDGVIYILTGAGGAPLHGDTQGKLKPRTVLAVSDRHSYTLCDVEGRKLTVRQLGSDGEEIDRFTITK
ncbi:MAG TPA: metallophosphoesterase [Candidatus Obscuribacterales bacterium]